MARLSWSQLIFGICIVDCCLGIFLPRFWEEFALDGVQLKASPYVSPKMLSCPQYHAQQMKGNALVWFCSHPMRNLTCHTPVRIQAVTWGYMVGKEWGKEESEVGMFYETR